MTLGASPPPLRPSITGLVLCGGRGSRMGGVDKGLQPVSGVPLVSLTVRRLQPQVDAVMLNANRNLDTYGALGYAVWPDPLEGYLGPLAGWLAGLDHCETPWMLSVPCDTPGFPADLAERLAAAALAANADIAMAVTPDADGVQRQPVFSLLRRSLRDDLALALQAGERKIDRWTARHRCVEVRFDDVTAFFNANTPDELARLRSEGPAT